jgi:hypothetical protein
MMMMIIQQSRWREIQDVVTSLLCFVRKSMAASSWTDETPATSEQSSPNKYLTIPDFWDNMPCTMLRLFEWVYCLHLESRYLYTNLQGVTPENWNHHQRQCEVFKPRKYLLFYSNKVTFLTDTSTCRTITLLHPRAGMTCCEVFRRTG